MNVYQYSLTNDSILVPVVPESTLPHREVSLEFKDITLESLPLIRPYLAQVESNTCDFTIGGIYMWIDYFHYQYAIADETLFILGREEDDRSKLAFSVPIGKMPLSQSLAAIQRYCDQHDFPMILSAVPEMYLNRIVGISRRQLGVTNMPEWADYIYSINDLASLSGKKFSKKRNHVNKFMALYPDAKVFNIDQSNIERVKEFYKSLRPRMKEVPMALYEYNQTGMVLENFDSLRFISMVLEVEGEIVSFMIGEIQGDTLHAHIEKTNHDFEGASEYINREFAAYALTVAPSLRYENRQDDAGDEGLRKSKLSYNPIALLPKYNIRF